MTWIRATYGPLAMATALAVAALIPNPWLAAAACTAVAVALIRPWRHNLGLTGGIRPFLIGLAVPLAGATLLFTLGTLTGWLTWGPIDTPQLLRFLITNTAIAVLLEAFPEELTLRGHTYTTLRHTRPWIAAAVTTALFLTVPALSSVIQWALTLGTHNPTLVPPGEDPVSYLILLTIFGLTLITARNATGSLWTSIGTHLMFLTINRITLYGEDRNAGWSMRLDTPDAILLIPAYLLLTAMIFHLTRHRRIATSCNRPVLQAKTR
ncbi:CPBP family glutamic-type intramembrane protease [Kribbella sp. NPDC051770]|uniref:CPBP family glutamic-type intramembrane protease n=1 Tax=Kribbella sp. NPDC051770 TaxID=3155413 RepID=UPI00343A4E70